RRHGLPNAVDVGEPHLDALVGWDVDASDSSHQPCLCLCRGLEQMTSTTPRRRMIRQRSHIGFTDARTFTLYSLGRIQSTSEQGDSGQRQGGQGHGHDAAAHEPVGRLVDDLATRSPVHHSSFRRLVYWEDPTTAGYVTALVQVLDDLVRRRPLVGRDGEEDVA